MTLNTFYRRRANALRKIGSPQLRHKLCKLHPKFVGSYLHTRGNGSHQTDNFIACKLLFWDEDTMSRIESITIDWATPPNLEAAVRGFPIRRCGECIARYDVWHDFKSGL